MESSNTNIQNLKKYLPCFNDRSCGNAVTGIMIYVVPFSAFLSVNVIYSLDYMNPVLKEIFMEYKINHEFLYLR